MFIHKYFHYCVFFLTEIQKLYPAVGGYLKYGLNTQWNSRPYLQFRILKTVHDVELHVNTVLSGKKCNLQNCTYYFNCVRQIGNATEGNGVGLQAGHIIFVMFICVSLDLFNEPVLVLYKENDGFLNR